MKILLVSLQSGQADNTNKRVKPPLVPPLVNLSRTRYGRGEGRSPGG